MKNYKKEANEGITLIALVITVIVMLILAGVAINVTIGENGIFKKTEEAKEISIRSQLKEELELEITDLQLEKSKNGEQITKEDITKRLENIATVDNATEEVIEGEYKDYPFEIDENNQVIIGDKLVGVKPTGEIEILTKEDGVEEVEIRVTGAIEEGEIIAIEALDGAELKEDKSNVEKIFKVNDNGMYKFRIRGSNGRSARVSCTVTNIIPLKTDLLTAVKEIEEGGVQKVRVKGRTSEIAEEEIALYSFNVIRHEGDVVLDGTTPYEGSTLANNVYQFGDASKDISTGGYAANTVVLKVEGNLTINDGVTLTAIGGTYGGPKGMIVYCTGTLTNNGTMSMTARGAKAVGQNVYLYKNFDGSFEFVPSVGGKGTAPVRYNEAGIPGGDGIGRQTRWRC